MRSKKVRFLSLLAAATLLASGCASGDGASSKQSSAAAPSEADSQTSAVSETADAPEGGEPITLKVLMGNQPTDPNKEPPHDKITELTGYYLDCYMLPAERAEEKLNLELASGTEYDIVMINPTSFRNLAGKNAFLEISDLIDQYGPNVKQAVTEEEWGSSTVDGKVVGVPAFDARYIGGGIAVNVDMFKEAGVEFKNEMTIDEYTAALRALKAKYPEVIPMTGSTAWSEGIMSAFNLTTQDFPLIDGKVTPKMTNPGLKDYVTYMNELYTEGLIDAEWPTNTGEVLNEKFTSGKAAIAWMGWWNATTINEAVKTATGSEVDYIHPLFSNDGKSVYGINTGVTGFRAIPKSSQKAEDVVKFWNLYADPKNFETIFIGEEGVHHEIRDENGEKSYWPIFPAFTEWFNGHYFNMVTPRDTFTTLWLCRVRKSEELYSAFERMNTYSEDHWVADSLAYAPPLPAVTKYAQSAGQLAGDTIVEFIAGSKPLSEWDSFIEKWKSEGGAEMISEAEDYTASLS